jgi:hypothetical protein
MASGALRFLFGGGYQERLSAKGMPCLQGVPTQEQGSRDFGAADNRTQDAVVHWLRRIELEGLSLAHKRSDAAKKIAGWNQWVIFSQSVATQDVEGCTSFSPYPGNSVDAKYAGPAAQNNLSAMWSCWAEGFDCQGIAGINGG